jgi:hypothetical protein
MRLAGVETGLLTRPWLEIPAPTLSVRADCCINEPELKSRFTLPESVRYEEGYQPERHYQDNPWAKLSGSQCGSAIDLVHSEWPRATIQWFPTKPAA